MITRTGIAETQSPKFAGHETFSLRYGWPKKAVDATTADPLVFTRDEAVITLGVGKNMVRSIRHWGLMTGILEEDAQQPNNRGRFIRPSTLGTLLFDGQGLDPYLEEPGTLWLLHWNLASRPDGPTTWYWAFNHFSEAEFTKERLIAALQDISQQADWTRVADNSLKRDVDCFIRTYVPSRATKTLVLEDSLDSPLAELELIQEIEGGRVYAFARGEHPSLPLAVFAYALLDYWQTSAAHREALSFDELAFQPGSPGRVFKLSENAVSGYLESLETFTDRALGYDVTAGLRQVYRRSKLDPLDLLQHLSATRRKGPR